MVNYKLTHDVFGAQKGVKSKKETEFKNHVSIWHA